MARLRGPGGCPWDREQTFDTIKRHTLEETYEVFDAIERRAWPDLKDELGDLLLQVLFYAQMAAEAGYFDIGDVAAGLNAKLVRRHPHVFPRRMGNWRTRPTRTRCCATGSRSSGRRSWRPQASAKSEAASFRAGRYSAHHAGDAGGRRSWARVRPRWVSTGRAPKGSSRSCRRRLRS